MSIEWHREDDYGLLPCPFCGSPARAWRVYATPSSLPWQIECSNYECGIGTHGYETREEAAEVWNRWDGGLRELVYDAVVRAQMAENVTGIGVLDARFYKRLEEQGIEVEHE